MRGRELVLGGVLGLLGCAHAAEPAVREEPVEPPRVAVAIRLEEAPDEATDGLEMPATRATLVLIHDEGRTERHELGIYLGACTPRPAQRGELVRVECWWAGAGEHLTARRGGHHVVVMATPVDEGAGLGNAVVKARVELPDGVEIDPIGP